MWQGNKLVVWFGLLIFLGGCAGITPSQPQPPKPTGGGTSAQSSILYVGSLLPDPLYFVPSNIPDELAAFRIESDGSLTKLGAFGSSVFPMGFDFTGGLASGGRWLFADTSLATSTDSGIREFHINSDGSLTLGADVSKAGFLVGIVAVDPSGAWLIANGAQGQQAFRIQSDGTLSPGALTPFTGRVTITAPARGAPALFDPTGQFFIVADMNSATLSGVYRLDMNTGSFTLNAPLPAEYGGRVMGFTADGRHLLQANGDDHSTFDFSIFDWDPDRGTLTLHGHSQPVNAFAGAFATADNLIFLQANPQCEVFRFDPTTASITDTGQRFPSLTGWQFRIVADANTHTVIQGLPDNRTAIWKYDPGSGAVTAAPGSPHPAGTVPMLMDLIHQ